MQAGGTLRQGVGTIPARRRPNALLLTIAAVLVVAAVLALLVWVVPLATSGGAAEEVIPESRAGSAVIHDDAGNVDSR